MQDEAKDHPEEGSDNRILESKSSGKKLYKFHAGSIRVSGKSQVFKTGLSAFHEWMNGTRPIEFVFIGANAGQQALKASVVAKREIEGATKHRIGFVPLWSTVVTDPRENEAGCEKDILILRLVKLPPSKNALAKMRKAKNAQETASKEVKPNSPQAQGSSGTLTTHKPFANLTTQIEAGGQPQESKED